MDLDLQEQISNGTLTHFFFFISEYFNKIKESLIRFTRGQLSSFYHTFSAVALFGFHRVIVDPDNLHVTSNWTFCLIYRVKFFPFLCPYHGIFCLILIYTDQILLALFPLNPWLHWSDWNYNYFGTKFADQCFNPLNTLENHKFRTWSLKPNIPAYETAAVGALLSFHFLYLSTAPIVQNHLHSFVNDYLLSTVQIPWLFLPSVSLKYSD